MLLSVRWWFEDLSDLVRAHLRVLAIFGVLLLLVAASAGWWFGRPVSAPETGMSQVTAACYDLASAYRSSRSTDDARRLMDSCPPRYATEVIGGVVRPAPQPSDGSPIP